jgi:hypothetical protein
MNPQDTNNHIRPGFVVLLVCLVAVVVVPFWMYKTKSAGVVVETPLAMKSPDVAETQSNSESAAGEPGGAEIVAVVQPSNSMQPSVVVQPTAPVAPARPAGSSTLELQRGIQFFDAQLVMDDSMVELHYAVSAPDKAALLTHVETEAYLIEQTSGVRIPLCPPLQKNWPFPDHSRARSMALMMPEAGTFPPPPNRLTVGKTYAILLPNPNGILKTGSQVVVVVGNFRSDVFTL